MTKDNDLIKLYQRYTKLSAESKRAIELELSKSGEDGELLELLKTIERNQAKRRYYEIGTKQGNTKQGNAKQGNTKQNRAPIRRMGGTIRVL